MLKCRMVSDGIFRARLTEIQGFGGAGLSGVWVEVFGGGAEHHTRGRVCSPVWRWNLSRPCGTRWLIARDPALKRRAIPILSLRDKN